MTTTTPTRQDAFALLTTCNKSESLIKHALSVEDIMRHFAAKRMEDPEMWGIIGLIHDLDYAQYPEQHCHKTREILEEHYWPKNYIRAARLLWILVTGAVKNIENRN